MMMLIFIFGILLAFGLFFILADVLKLPYLSAAKAMLSTTRAEKKAAKSIETYLMTWAVKLSKYIRMDEYRKSSSWFRRIGFSIEIFIKSRFGIQNILIKT